MSNKSLKVLQLFTSGGERGGGVNKPGGGDKI